VRHRQRVFRLARGYWEMSRRTSPETFHSGVSKAVVISDTNPCSRPGSTESPQTQPHAAARALRRTEPRFVRACFDDTGTHAATAAELSPESPGEALTPGSGGKGQAAVIAFRPYRRPFVPRSEELDTAQWRSPAFKSRRYASAFTEPGFCCALSVISQEVKP
jgi:hypothetical protein